MTPAARIATAAEILDQVLDGVPAEKALTSWARRSRFAGSKDRAAIRDHVFDALRCQRSLSALGGSRTGRGLMIGQLREAGVDPATHFTGEGHAPAPLSADELAAGRPPEAGAEAGDIPDWCWPRFASALGDQAAAVAAALRHRAPVHIRVNTARCTPDALAQELGAEGIELAPAPLAPAAMTVTTGARRLTGTQAFAQGRFEMQDAGSQAICAAIPLTPGQSVLDYCAGGGGKALALAAREKLVITAHDAAPARMRDLPARAERAGVRITLAQDSAALKGPYDLVLCDVPCSGSGAWRRAPDGKWRLTEDALLALLDTQAQILRTAAPLVAPGGLLAYATCSLFREENQDQIAGFLRDAPDWQLVEDHRWTPLDGGDGFYLGLLRRS